MTGGEITSLIAAAVLGGLLSLVLFRRLRARAAASTAIEADPDPVLLISPRDIALNRAAAHLLGGDDFTSIANLGDVILLQDEEAFPDWVARLGPGGDATAQTAAGAVNGVPVRVSAYSGPSGITVRLLDCTIERTLQRDLALRTEERDRFRKILDGLPLPVWWRRPGDLKVAGANATYRRSVGLTDTDDIEHTGRDILAGLVPDDGTALAQRALSRAAQQSESHYVVIDGDRRLFDFVEQRLNEDDWTVGYGEDRTALEAMQASVGESIAANDAVLEQLLTAIAVFGPDRRLNFYNRAFAEMWGLEENYLTAEPIFEEVLDLLHDRRQMPETVDVRADIRNRVRHFTSLVETHEELLHLPDERSVRLSIVPHPMGGLLYQYEDVTDKLALERSFNTLTQVQQATLNNLYEGVAVFSRDGRMRLHNRAYREIWELGEEDLRGAPHIGQILDRIKPLMPDTGDWQKFRRENVVAVTEPRADVGRFELTDNRIIDFAEVPLPDGQCLLVYLDVSDSVRVQRVLEERNAALENADLLKSQFISNMSYELRTPLNTIVGFSEVLQNGIAGPLTDRQQDYVLHVLTASRHLARMVGDILDLATIQAGFMRLDLQDADIGSLVNDAIGDVQAVASEKSVSLVVESPPSDLGAFCDPDRIQQVLTNLLTNAVRFTPEGGRVSIRTEEAALDQPYASVTIQDTGDGISDGGRDKVFESFVQASSGTRQSGAGLGLALSKSLIELHGGKIDVSGAPGGGAQITCLIPKNQRRRPVQEAHA